MQMALDLRNASEQLYRSCLDAERQSPAGVAHAQAPADAGAARRLNKSTQLKIDLTGIRHDFVSDDVPSQRTIQLIYHLLLHWDALPDELCIEGPILDLHELRGFMSVLEVHEASRISQESAIIIDDDHSQSKIFRSRLPRDSERLFTTNANARASISLADYLDSLDNLDLDLDACMRIFPFVDEEKYNAIDLTIRLWLMINVGVLHPERAGQRLKIFWAEDKSLEQILATQFNNHPSNPQEKSRWPFMLNACNLERLGGFDIVWTDDLSDHLLLDEDDKSIRIFHHATVLKVQSKTGTNLVLPSDLVEETLQTQALLIRRVNQDCKSWLMAKLNKALKERGR